MLNCQFPINLLGYGTVGRGICLGFNDLNIDISLWPIGSVECESHEQEYIKKYINNQDIYDNNADSIRLFHQFSLAEHIGKGKKIGFPIFELDKFTKREIHHLSNQDKLVVCSKWAKNILIQNNINVPITICPLGVNRNIFNEHNTNKPDQSWTTFLSVGKWEKRKGHDILAKAFNLAFQPSDRVRLWLLTSNPFLNKTQTMEWENLYKNGPMGDKVTFIPRVPTQSQVAGIMAMADCGVFPSRAEGWNLEALEMLSMGKRLIITDYSAHTEFCTINNSLLIPVTNTELAEDGIWFHGQGNWGHLGRDEMECLITYLRGVAHDKSYEINQAGIDTAKLFSWKNTAEKLWTT